MSTGLDCHFFEKEPGRWYYDLETWEQREQYDTYGEFATLEIALQHLHDNHANPGGYSVSHYVLPL